MEQSNQPNDYILTLFEVCEILNKSSRTVSRYVHRNILHPAGIKSRQGTLEYRFSKSEVDELKRKDEQLRQIPFLPDIPSNPVASFASVGYQPPAIQQSPYVIPGMSYPPLPEEPADKKTGEPASVLVPGKPVEQVTPLIETNKEETIKDTIETTETEKNIAAAPIIDTMPVISRIKEPLEPENKASLAKDNTTIQTRSDGEIITLLKETTEMLRGQLKVKDDQIKNLDEKIGQLIERNRETNILLKGLQDKMVLLGKTKEDSVARQNSSASMIQSQEINQRPSAAPKPEIPSNAIKVRISQEMPADSLPDKQVKRSIDIPQANPYGNINEEWQEGQRKNINQSKGFFGKIFR